jgi:hypothetical protein
MLPTVYSHSSGLKSDFKLLTFWIMGIDFFSLLVNYDISVVCEVDIIHPVMRIKKSPEYLILIHVSTLFSLILCMDYTAEVLDHPVSTMSVVFCIPFIVQVCNSKASSPSLCAVTFFYACVL